MDNFQFVSQLGQFAQLQQSQSLNDQITTLLSAQAATQATSLLGKTVDVANGQSLLSGKVTAVSFSSGQPLVTIITAQEQTIGSISIADITQVR